MIDHLKRTLPRIACSLVAFAWFATAAVQAAPDRVTVAWDPNPETDIAGYRVYYGRVGTTVTNMVSPGTLTQQQVISLLPATQYWFYVTAFNAAGLESDPSQVLTYTTPVNQSPTVTLGTDRIAIIPDTVSISAQAADDYLAPESLSKTWAQLSGPATATITGATTLSPQLQLPTAGTYRFRLTVSDGSLGAFDEVAVHAYPQMTTPPPGSVVPNLASVVQTFDGLVLQWNSAPGANYRIGRKGDLNQSTWSILADNIASQGPTTYWVDESGQLSLQGFYAIFQIP